MSIFDSFADAPFQIKTEGETITLTFARGVPAVGQGTVSWNIPSPAAGCQTKEDGRGAYCGFVVVAHDKPVQLSNAPVDGTYYTADPTLDKDTHIGDKIGDALVIGAFYEGEKRGQNLPLTTSFVVSDVQAKTPYYIAGYAVDCQGRYHTNGVRAYSDKYAGEDEPNTPSKQLIILGDTGKGVLPTDGTGLVSGKTYEFEVEIDLDHPTGKNTTVIKVSVDGGDVTTYEDLIAEINKQFALGENPPQSPTPPNQGRYYWNGTALYQWDGQSHTLTNCLIEPTDPASANTGDHWYDTANEILYRWNTPIANTWNEVNVLTYTEDPTELSGGNDYWFNGNTGYVWCDNTWCEQNTFVTQTNPALPLTITECGVHWYDEINSKLYYWSLERNEWVETYAITWNVAPNSFATGTYWFNDTTQQLFIRDGGWTEVVPVTETVTGSPLPLRVVVSTIQPTSPADQLHWYNPTTEVLAIWNESTSQFVVTPVLVWPQDPTNTSSCDLWWNTNNNKLYKWDVVNGVWNQVSTFYISGTDPVGTPTLELGTLWYNPTNEQLYRWDGVCFIAVEFFNVTNNPTTPVDGTAWYNPTTKTWSVWNVAGGSPSTQWTIINPIESAVNPFLIPSGTLWFNTSTNSLFERIGSTWVSVPYSTTPYTPATGQKWFDTTNNILYVWNGSSWVRADQLVTTSIDDEGNMLFQTTATGSNVCMQILVPSNSTSGAPNYLVATGTAGADYINNNVYEPIRSTTTTVKPEDFIFDHLTPKAYILRNVCGGDGVEALPSYLSVGIGDDGSPDERRNIADDIRAQLGYPTVQVELTPQQINIAINRALETLRKHTSVAYQRGFFFLDINPREQHYKLTDKTVGFHKVVTVMSAYRFTSAFLSSAHGSGVYGQIVLQHLYNMGTFDLLSYHLVAQYVETMEHLFATRLTYHWNETNRLLSFYHSFTARERVLLDVTLERTEQELFKDRWTKTWLSQYALAESMRILAQIRGKFATLPGAGGGIALNASDLIAQADLIQTGLFQQIDDFVVNDAEDIGLNSTLIIG